MNNVIQFYRFNVYGRELCYTTNKEVAYAIKEMTGALTLTPQIQKGLEMLGFTFEEVIRPRS